MPEFADPDSVRRILCVVYAELESGNSRWPSRPSFPARKCRPALRYQLPAIIAPGAAAAAIPAGFSRSENILLAIFTALAQGAGSILGSCRCIVDQTRTPASPAGACHYVPRATAGTW
jgi:hypothetical protein